MKIILADLPKKERDYDLSYPSVALLYLIGYARKHFGEKHQFHYLEGHCTLNEHIETLRKIQPDIYGITITSPNTFLAYKTIRAVRDNFPGVKILCGGPHVTALPEHVFEHCPADICIRGEGEATFVELIKHFEGYGKPLNEISGITYRNADGKLAYNDKRELIRDLDSIPMPAWEFVKDFNRYSGMHFRKASPQSRILLSRGCPFDCNFCSNPVWKYNKPWVRLRSPSKIAEEVQRNYELGVREIYLEADEFNVSVDWAEQVCDSIAALGLKKDLFFHVNIRADNFTPRLAQKLAGINVWLAHLGIESGNQRTLDGIGKHIKLEQIIRACEYLKEAKVKIFGFLMLFHVWEDENGQLCWESPEDVKNTMSFTGKLLREGFIDYFSWQIATPLPGSRLFELAKRHNLLISQENYLFIRSMAMRLPGITEKDIMKAVRKGVLLKTYCALKNGNININEAWSRGKESVKNILGIRT
jgi:radical SAM superfamily enzyme YgiQ (UPF0313 family)